MSWLHRVAVVLILLAALPILPSHASNDGAPTATDWAPNITGKNGDIYGPAQPTIQASLIDADGVDPETITMHVNGETILANGTGPATISEIPETCPDCYRVSYQPNTPLPHRSTVRVEISASDQAQPANTPETPDTYRFEIDRRPPTITLVPRIGEPRTHLQADTADTSGVRSVTVHFTPDENRSRSLPLHPEGDHWRGRLVNPTTGEPYPNGTRITFYLEAQDALGHRARTPNETILEGNHIPKITLTQPDPGAQVDDTIPIAWQASDTETPTENLTVSLSVLIDGAPRQIPEALGLPAQGTFQWTPPTWLPPGNLTLQALVFDGSAFGQATVPLFVPMADSLFDTLRIAEEPAQNGAKMAPSASASLTLELPNETRAAWANLTQSGVHIDAFKLDPGDGGPWSTQLTAPQTPGTYTLTVTQVRHDGVHRSSLEDALRVEPVPGAGAFALEWILLATLFGGAVVLGTYGVRKVW